MLDKNNLVVLVVDDDMINFKLMQGMLKKSGHFKEFIQARNGLDALDILKIRQEEIDLVLLDIFMPVMNGIEMLKTVRTNEIFGELPILIYSSDDTKKSEVLEFGANAFLVHPIRKNELIKNIETVLEIQLL